MFDFIRQFFGFEEANPYYSDVAIGIANEFRGGKIVHRHLDGHGISELGVMYNGRKVVVTWYSTSNPRSLSIDGNTSFPEGRDSKLIFNAAIGRAKNLINEDLEMFAKEKQ